MVETGTLFAYLSAFITIVVALAFGDLALSTHRILRARDRISWHPLPLIAAFYVLMTLLVAFFGLWSLTKLEEITFYGLLWKITPVFFLFLSSCAVLPDEVPPEGLDLWSFYISQRRYIYAALLGNFVLDNLQHILSLSSDIIADPVSGALNLLVTATYIVAMAVLFWRSEKLVHWIGLVGLLLVSQVGYAFWSIAGASALQL